ncbi:MAG: EAL domain-containing protein, partial [Parvibaculaceae bacterium]
VNVSSSQFLAADLIDDVKALLTREGLVRETLKLEVTESIVMENPELVSQILDRLKQMGIGVACDDFGTGYSSLSNLRRMPFDTLKVDRSFIEADTDDAKASLILESIVLLAHDLGLTVVAEGIQSQDDVDRLGALACDFGQGYFIGEPMTAKQVVDVLSGVPLSAAKHKTTIDSLWERMAGTSNVRVPEPLPETKPAPPPETKAAPQERKPAPPPEKKPEPPKPQPQVVQPQPAAVKPAAPEPAPVKQPEPPPAPEQRRPEAAPLPPPPESRLVKPGKPPIVLLPPLTPPVFGKGGGPGPHRPAAEAPPKPAAPVPEAVHEETSDLVKSDPAHAARPPLPGGAPMAPRAPAQDDADDAGEAEESDISGDETEPSGQTEEEIAAQKAKSARLGKKLRRKALAKDQPPAET